MATILQRIVMGIEKIIYVADPMCSWCWGFSPVIEQLREHLSGKLPVDIIMGGLRDGHAWDEEFREFLHASWEHVARATAQPFNTGILSSSHFNYTTEPACRAVVTLNQYSTDLAFEGLKRLQNAFYAENRDITQEEVIIELMSTYFKLQDFEGKYTSDACKKLTLMDRQKARLYGATSFPSLVLLGDEGHLSVIKGYRDFDELTAMLAI